MINDSFTQTITVDENQTAIKYGSGLLPVFATPALIALMENTAMHLLELPEGSSSVGISLNMKHLKATPVGARVNCTAILAETEGRKYSFKIEATDENGFLIGDCFHERVVVDINRFMSKLW